MPAGSRRRSPAARRRRSAGCSPAQRCRKPYLPEYRFRKRCRGDEDASGGSPFFVTAFKTDRITSTGTGYLGLRDPFIAIASFSPLTLLANKSTSQKLARHVTQSRFTGPDPRLTTRAS